MKSFHKMSALVIIFMLAMIIAANIILINIREGDQGRPYRVEAERAAYDIEQGKEVDLTKYSSITGVQKLQTLTDTEEAEALFDADNDYIIKQINGELYRFEYKSDDGNTFVRSVIILNICSGAAVLFVVFLLLYIKIRIIKPFDSMKELPLELAKGNIMVPIKAEKSDYFGSFIWGLNLLKEKLEKGRQQDLELKKNNKSLILSISHDIKTPIGIIELNAKALERGLYDNDKEKKDRITVVIKEKCNEITEYVDQIIKASREEFLELEVKNREFYLSEAINRIKTGYSEKMDLQNIDFTIQDYSDCLLKGDPDRAVEVIQNLLENAIKYGDGKGINISFSREENSQLISVINTGCTLDDSELPHIFDSFWRGSNKGANAGSGLGLYICKQLMNRMNGDIFAEIRDGKMIVTAVLGMA